jgi:phage gp36-like protein
MYIEQADIEKGIYPEVLTVISRNPGNITTAIEEAMAEVRSYLTARYDMDAEYARTGSSRHVLVVKLVRDIALYNCYNISNPVNMPESRVQKYKDCIVSLKDIQSERASIDGLTRLDGTPSTGSNYLKFGGNTKRKTSY